LGPTATSTEMLDEVYRVMRQKAEKRKTTEVVDRRFRISGLYIASEQGAWYRQLRPDVSPWLLNLKKTGTDHGDRLICFPHRPTKDETAYELYMQQVMQLRIAPFLDLSQSTDFIKMTTEHRKKFQKIFSLLLKELPTLEPKAKAKVVFDKWPQSLIAVLEVCCYSKRTYILKKF
jgi:hypothetical protein